MKRDTILIILLALLMAVIVIVLVLSFTIKPAHVMAKLGDSASVISLLQSSLTLVLQQTAKENIALPEMYDNCGGSTVNRIVFCGNVKASGSYDVGGSFACDVPRQTCRAACFVSCQACHLVPFVSCTGPCRNCPNACETAYQACAHISKVEWSVNVLELYDLLNTMQVKSINDVSWKDRRMKANVLFEISPVAKIDVRTTGEIGNYQGPVNLGTMQITTPIEIQFPKCSQYEWPTMNIDTIKISGVNLNFHFADSFVDRLKRQLYDLAKGQIESAVQRVLESKLTLLVAMYIPRILRHMTIPICD